MRLLLIFALIFTLSAQQNTNGEEGQGQGIALPYYEGVPGGLHPGMAVYVNGTVPEDSFRFGVNFVLAKDEEADIAFHFNPRFQGWNRLVLNTFQSGRWGKERQRQNPFRRGEHFELIINVTEAGYQILVNRKQVYVFRHRIPPQRVQFIKVAGDLELQSLNVTAEPMIGNTSSDGCGGGGTMALPYYESVPGGLHPGMAVYVNGTVPEDSFRFGVNFVLAKDEEADIAFHFNPRFQGWNRLVLNTFEFGSWQREEKCQNPFRRGEHFELIINVTEAGYQILVNRKLFYVFQHRIPPERVKFIMVAGDLELQSLNVTAKPVIGNVAHPYDQTVLGGLHPGMSIYVNGTVPEDSGSFSVDFASCQHKGADVPLHFNPRFHTDELGLSTFQAGTWGEEEKHRNPFRKGEPFEILFIVTEAEYQILVNGYPFGNYSHRSPPQGVQLIRVSGDLELQSLNVMGTTIVTSLAIYHPAVPYTGNIPGGMGPEKIITVQGSIPKNAIRFEINFMAGQDIPLRIDFQMKPLSAVIRNSLLNDNWGKEERSLTFNPLQPGQYFKLTIFCDNLEFKIYANDQPFFNYAHRYIHIEHIRTLEINGDVTLSYIKY